MKKGFSIVEVLVVIVIMVVLVALLLPVINAARRATERLEQENQATISAVKESGLELFDGDFAYLVLDGRKVQITGRGNGGMYWVRYSDNVGHLEEVSLHYFELVDERPLMEVKDDTR
jgi:prepilin-type N-terminal cleavage/methylation domain-containing protein